MSWRALVLSSIAVVCLSTTSSGTYAAQPAARQHPGFQPHPVLAKLPSNTAMDLGPYKCTDVQGESPGKCKFITDYSGMVFDKRRREFLVFGGGHASTNYDAVNAFNLDTLAWKEKYKPTGCPAMLAPGNFDESKGAWNFAPSMPFPRASARHTVDLMVIPDEPDELILLSHVEGNGQCAGMANYTSYNFRAVGKIAHYNLATDRWSFSDSPPELQWPAAEYDPLSKKVVMLGLDGLMIYDPVTRTKGTVLDVTRQQLPSEHGPPVSHGTLRYNNHLVYFPPNHKMYYFDRFDKRVFEVTLDRSDFAKSRIVALATTGTASPHGEPGYAYDSVNQIIGGGVHANKFYAFNPVTKAWTSRDIQGGKPGNQAYHALGYDEVNNVYIFVSEARQTWAYRYAR
jgi:hypothetical protein